MKMFQEIPYITAGSPFSLELLFLRNLPLPTTIFYQWTSLRCDGKEKNYTCKSPTMCKAQSYVNLHLNENRKRFSRLNTMQIPAERNVEIWPKLT